MHYDSATDHHRSASVRYDYTLYYSHADFHVSCMYSFVRMDPPFCLGKDVPSVRLPTLTPSVGSNYRPTTNSTRYTSEDSNVPDWFNSDER
jgi:hypothetical protein